MADSFLYGLQRCFAEVGEKWRWAKADMCMRVEEYESGCGRSGMRENVRMRMKVDEYKEVRL